MTGTSMGTGQSELVSGHPPPPNRRACHAHPALMSSAVWLYAADHTQTGDPRTAPVELASQRTSSRLFRYAKPSGRPPLDPAPVEPTTDDSGTGSAHKNSAENPDEPTSTGRGMPGDSGRETAG